MQFDPTTANTSAFMNQYQADVTKESEFIDQLIAAGVEAVVMSPVSTEASVAAVERLAEAGIPIVCYNTCLSDADSERLIYALVTTSQFDLGLPVGILAGEWANKAEIELKIGISNLYTNEIIDDFIIINPFSFRGLVY